LAFTWSFNLRRKYGLRALEVRVLTRMFGPKGESNKKLKNWIEISGGVPSLETKHHGKN
jgi:hypothetical protein